MDWLFHEPLTRFLVQTAAIIAACRGLGLLMRRIGQPAVIAEIGAGIILGPSVLGWLLPDVFHAMFPRGSLGIVRIVSQLGLLLFMFLVGLELDLRLLRGRLRSSFAISGAAIAVPFALGIAVALALPEELRPEQITTGGFAVFVGAVMAVTALPVVARILAERRLLRTRLGAIAIACAATGDMMAWCLLAFAVSIVRATGIGSALLTTALALAFVAVMLLLVRPLLARLAARVGTPGAMSQNLVALVLLVVLVSSWVTGEIGIHVLFGAFLFGVIIPKEGGFARALAEKLEDVIVVLLLPLFFAVSGLRTEIGLVTSTDHLVICGALILIATLGKVGGAAIAARIGGIEWREAGALGVLMNTRGLQELIVLNIGLELGVLNPTLFSMLVVMALVTTFATSPLLERIYPASAMAHDVLEDEPRPPAAPSTSRVMVCVSDGSAGPALVHIAGALAGPRGELIVLHLTNPSERSSARVGDPADEAALVMRPALDHAAELGIPVRPLSFVSNELAEDIARVADVRGVDVAVLGLHKPVLKQTFLGGVVHDVMERADVTVAVYVERRRVEPRRVLVALQGTPDDDAVRALAARVQGAHVEALEHPPFARAADFDLVIVGVTDQPERWIRECPTSIVVVRGGRQPLATARIASE